MFLQYAIHGVDAVLEIELNIIYFDKTLLNVSCAYISIELKLN